MYIKNTNIYLSLIFLFVLSAISGCAKVIRENILSSINTGIGATLAENPQTQFYEVKVGYIRSQFYSIPTGKMILEEDSDRLVPQSNGSQPLMTKYNPNTMNAADKTPQVVSGIKVHTGVEQLFLGVDVSENFAVGIDAVKSPAAIAMYITETQNAGVASAASQAASASVKSITTSDPNAEHLKAQILSIYNSADDPTKSKFISAAKSAGFADFSAFIGDTSVPVIKVNQVIQNLKTQGVIIPVL